MPDDSTSTPQQVQDWLHQQIALLGPLSLGSLSFRKAGCGKPNCSSCKSGEKHRSHVLYGKIGQRRHTVYVPQDLVPEVERAIANGRRLQELLQEAGRRYALALKREAGPRQGKRQRRQSPAAGRE
jgi:hypothetical protein